MRKKIALAAAAVLMLTLLSGCFRSVEDFYTLPKLSEEFQNLQAKIEEITGAGAEYSAPLRGEHNQPVQLQDLDGDGVLEAIAFFRTTSTANSDEKPLKIYVFRLTGDGYEVGGVIEGEGSAVYSISYEDLSGGSGKELAVSWLSGGSALTLAVYSVGRNSGVEELMRSSYTSMKIQDLDKDNRKELALVRMDAIEGKNRVELWGSDGEKLVLRSTAALSQGVTGIDTDGDGVQVGMLQGSTAIPALFVTSFQGEGILTDIFAWRENALVNITMEQSDPGAEGSGGVSYLTKRTKADAKITDINDDNVLEIPMPVNMASGDISATAEVLYTWYQYDLSGNSIGVFTTYHNFEDNWYFILQDEWVGQLNVRQYTSVTGEKATTFSLEEDEEGSEVFLTIYRLTGPNRHMRARMGQRFILSSDDNTIYCAEIGSTASSTLTEAMVHESFRQSRSDWSSAG